MSCSIKFSRESILNGFMACGSSQPGVQMIMPPSSNILPANFNSPDTPSSPQTKKKRKRSNMGSRRGRVFAIKYKCSYCDKLYKLRGALDRHIRMKHSNGTPASSHELIQHNDRVLSQRFEMNVRLCLEQEAAEAAMKKQQARLIRDSREHSSSDVLEISESSSPPRRKKRSRQTSEEEEKSSSSWSLREDERQESYVCMICMKSFDHKWILQRHENSFHRGIKPFVCETCGKGCVSRESLKKHEMCHLESHAKRLASFYDLNISWSCKFCGRSDFVDWDEMDDHRMKEHPEETRQIRYRGLDIVDERRRRENDGGGREKMCVDDAVDDGGKCEGNQITSLFVKKSVTNMIVMNSDDSDTYVFSDSD